MNAARFAFCMMIAVFSLATLAQDLESEQGTIDNLTIRIEKGKSFAEDIFALGNDVQVNGEVIGDVGGINSDIHIAGSVKGNITLLSGSLFLESGALVEGNIVVVGGEINRAEGTSVGGKLINYYSGEPPSSSRSFKMNLAYFFAQALLLYLLTLATFYIFPNQVNEAGFQLSQDVVRHTIVGTLTLAGFLVALLISFLLMVVMIGFPMFLIFATGFFVVILFGSAVVLMRLAAWLEERTKQAFSLVIYVFIVAVATILLLHIPFIGSLVIPILVLLGSGAVIETRFGTNRQWFTRKKRYW